ncbi:MAG TPA: TolC family protein [Thermoanaerobaculia bacterium]|nr:TolC family protein [Thermoanaerobaculia bacterium]
MTRMLIVWFILVLVASPAAAATVTLEQALKRALQANPSIARAQADVEAARAQRRLARSAILPRVDLEASGTRNEREIAFDLGGSTMAFQPRQDWSTRLVLRQPLYVGGREFKAIRQTALTIGVAEAASDSTEETILLRTASDYLSLVEADALIDVEHQNVDVSCARRKQAEHMLKAGEFTKVDVLRAEAAQKAAERQLAAAEQQRKEAESHLRLDLALDEEIIAVPPAFALPPVPGIEELTTASFASHPELKRAAASLDIARLETRKQHGAYLPIVMLNAAVTRQRAAFPSNESRAVGVSLHVPIFDSGEIASRIAVAGEHEKQAAASANEARQAIREEIVRSVAGLETARKSFELAQEQLAAAEGQYQQISSLYRSQEATSLDIDTAEGARAEARRAVVIGSLQTKLAELRVWFAAGSLKPTLLSKEH